MMNFVCEDASRFEIMLETMTPKVISWYLHQGPDDRPHMELGFQKHLWRNGGTAEQGPLNDLLDV